MIAKPVLWITHHLLWIVPSLALLVLFGGPGNRKPAREFSDGRIEFAPRRIAFWAWLLIILYLAHATTVFLKHSHGKFFDLVNAGCAGFLMIAILCSFPGTVVITGSCLQQVYWFRRNKRIRWQEIVEINTGEKSHTVIITGADGTKIVHVRQLADRRRLLLELKNHCGEELPPDFPREPIAGV